MKKIHIFLQNSIHFYFIAWVILTTLSFALFSMPFIWFSFVPLIMIIQRLSISQIIRYGFFYGVFYAFCTLYWLIAFHELSAAFVYPMLGMYWVMAMTMTRYASTMFPKARVFFFPLFWTAIDVFRSAGFLGFRWNLPVDALWKQLVFMQSADVIGGFGVGFLVLLVNSAIAEVLLYRLQGGTWKDAVIKNYFPVYLTLFLFLCNLAYGLSAMKSWAHIIDNKLKTQTIALMQPNRPGHSSWFQNEEELTTKYLAMVESIINQKPDLIVQTEIMIPTYLWENFNRYGEDHTYNRFQKQLLDQAKALEVPMVITHFGTDGGQESYNSATLVHYTNQTLKTNTFNKIHIVPFGEWIPGSRNWPWLDNLLSNIGAAWASPGKDFTVFQGLENIKFAIMICFEDLFSILGRIYVDKGVQYFVNSTNDGWAYRWKLGATAPLWQHLANTVHTSIALRRSIARSVNTGITGVIDPMGRIDLAPIPEYQDGIYVTDIHVMPIGHRSIYVMYGWITEYILFFMVISISLLTFFFDRRSKKLTDIL